MAYSLKKPFASFTAADKQRINAFLLAKVAAEWQQVLSNITQLSTQQQIRLLDFLIAQHNYLISSTSNEYKKQQLEDKKSNWLINVFFYLSGHNNLL